MHLQRIGATAIMDRSFARLPTVISRDRAVEVVAAQTRWILVDRSDDDTVRAALNTADLAAFLDERGAHEEEIHLLELPGQRIDVTFADSQATALEVQKALSDSQAEACCIQRTTAPLIKPIVGIVTQSHIENYRNHVE